MNPTNSQGQKPWMQHQAPHRSHPKPSQRCTGETGPSISTLQPDRISDSMIPQPLLSFPQWAAVSALLTLRHRETLPGPGGDLVAESPISPQSLPAREAPGGAPRRAPAQPLQGPAARSSSSHPTLPAGAAAALHPGSSCLGRRAPGSLPQPGTPQRRAV